MVHKKRIDTTLGFTIVELVVVIVVIGVLAAITIVSYNGIQNRARNVQVLSAVDAWEKAITMYYIENGTYPIESDAVYDGAYCLGIDPAPSGPFVDDGCYTIDGTGGSFYHYNQEVVDQIATVTTIPDIDIPTHSYTLGPGTTISTRGLLYYVSKGSVNGGEVSLSYSIDKESTCGRGEKTSETYGDVTTTMCRVYFVRPTED